jgi:hypothetical protein
MNTCGTCKYFGNPVDDNQQDWRVPDGYHVCRLIQDLNDGQQPKPALVIDASGYYAALCVKDEFGCNQWTQPDAVKSSELCPRCQQTMPGGVALHTDYCPALRTTATHK